LVFVLELIGFSMGSPRNRSKAFSAAALGVVLGTSATGYAAPPPPSKEPAKEAPTAESKHEELRRRGNKAAKEDRLGEAIDLWMAAYAIHPSYEVACAIGRTELLRWANALAGALWLTRCVNLAPVPERAQKDGAKELAEQQTEISLRDLARARVGALRILTDAGATIEVDGKSVGTAPLDDEAFVMPGAHRVVVSLGQRSRSVELRLAAGEGRTVDLALPALSTMPEWEGGAGRASNEAFLYAGLAVGGVGLGLSVGFGAAAFRLRGEEAEAAKALKIKYGYFACKTPKRQECVELRDTSGRADAHTAVSLISLSAAVAGGAMVAYTIFQPHRKVNTPTVQAAFVAAPGGGSLFMTGSF
jgi:hypothetical protein